MDTSKLMYRDALMKDDRILVTGGKVVQLASWGDAQWQAAKDADKAKRTV